MTKTKSQAVLVGLAEKVVMTYLQSFLAVLLLGQAIDASTAQAAAIAAIPAALTMLVNAMPTVPVGQPFILDLILRLLRTGSVAFAGTLLAQPVFQLNMSILKAAQLAAITAGLSLLKSVVAQQVGDHTSAALLPRSLASP